MLYVASVAVRGLAIALAHELAPDVRINGVAPGGTVGTDLRGPAALGLADQSSAPVPAATPSCRSVPPLQITLAPADHAASYVFLASDRARGHHRRVPPDGDIGIKT